MSVLLTIIVPAYNVEQYIEECLHSIYKVAEGNDDVEVLVVDDGSPDSSAEIVKRLQRQYPTLRMVAQENRGLGGARNTGIEQARGEYIWCVDSDDWLHGRWDELLLPVLATGRYDAVAIGASDRLDDGTERLRYNFQGLPTTISGPDFLATDRFTYCVPFTIYRRRYLTDNNLRFVEHLYHEDMEFTPRAYYRLREIALIDSSFYVVRSNPQSITRSVNFKKNFDLLRVARSLSRFMQSNVEPRHRYIYSRIISLVTNSALSNTALMDADTYRRFADELKNHPRATRHYLKSKKMKYICQGIIFALSPTDILSTYNTLLKKLK